MPVPTFKLNNGSNIPFIAFGIGTRWSNRTGSYDEKVENAIKLANSHGYQHFDAAESYNTEQELGKAIKDVNRQDLFITTKLKSGAGSNVKQHFNQSLEKLGLSYVDLYLIHNPFNANDDIVEQWKILEEIYESGKAKAIGVSNFTVKHLESILKIAKIKPTVNQIEYHPYLQNQSPGIVDFCTKHDILVEAYGPLSPIIRDGKGPLTPVLDKLALKYHKESSQILLRWITQNGVLPVTTSSKPERIQQTLDIFEFELEKEDVETIREVGSKHHFRAFSFDGVFDKLE